MNEVREKILLLLLGGLSFGYCITWERRWKVLENVSREWKKINREKFRNEINSLYRSKFIEKKKNSDGSIMVLLTEKGELKALNAQLARLKNKKDKWDRKWRMVAFDMPEKYKKGRDALRYKLKNIGFRELQKSVFIFPYECQKEITFLIKLYGLEKYVRYAVLEMIDNEEYCKNIFKL